jgi:hypothetical protein
MRKWDDPQSPMTAPPSVEPPEGERVRIRARAFRRWLARGAEPGGLRALADEQPHLPPEGGAPPGSREQHRV